MNTVLVVTSDTQLHSSLTTNTKEIRTRFCLSRNLDEAFLRAQQCSPECVLLDMALPNIDWLVILAQFRRQIASHIVGLTDTRQSALLLRSLRLENISFLPRTTRPHAILTYIEKGRQNGVLPTPSYEDKQIQIDLAHGMVIVRGQPLKLTNIEVKILTCLLSTPNQTVSYSEILSAVWGPEHQYQTHYIQTYINRLRDKLEVDPKVPRYLQNERGVGYRFTNAAIE